MKITFLGTGAADWEIEKRAEGDFFRRKTTVLINDDLLIDISPDVPDYIDCFGCSLETVKNILITHTHSDHYSPAAAETLFGEREIGIWCDTGAAERIALLPHMKKNIIKTYTAYKIGRYTVIAVSANHSVSDSSEQPLHYIISDGEKTLFWGCDGAWLYNRTWHELKKHTFDLIVFDGTLYDVPGDYRIFEHNNLKMITEMAATVRGAKLLSKDGKIMISHMSKYAQYSHEELEKHLADADIHAAYDGLVMEI